MYQQLIKATVDERNSRRTQQSINATAEMLI